MPQPTAIAQIYVLLPGLQGRAWQSGGLLIARKAAALLQSHLPTQVVTYRDREPDVPYLADLLPTLDPHALLIATWGPHINELSGQLAGRRLVYYAQSSGWPIRLPPTIPVLCLSRYILGQWMRAAPYNPLFLLGPVLEPDCRDQGLARDIDVLFIERKSTAYLRDHLVPALRERGNVHTVRDFIPRAELFQLYNRAQVYLYSSAPWPSGLVEGFGFQPLEATICGCAVFSNLHGGLADYLDPQLNAFKLEVYALGYDVERIVARLGVGPLNPPATLAALRATYSEAAFHARIDAILPELARFFGYAAHHPADIARLAYVAPVPAWRQQLYRVKQRTTRALQRRPKGAR